MPDAEVMTVCVDFTRASRARHVDFGNETADHIDLTDILNKYQRKHSRGAEGYHPLMLVRLLLYGYAVGIVSSRDLEKARAALALYDDLGIEIVACDLASLASSGSSGPPAARSLK